MLSPHNLSQGQDTAKVLATHYRALCATGQPNASPRISIVAVCRERPARRQTPQTPSTTPATFPCTKKIASRQKRSSRWGEERRKSRSSPRPSLSATINQRTIRTLPTRPPRCYPPRGRDKIASTHLLRPSSQLAFLVSAARRVRPRCLYIRAAQLCVRESL